MAKVVLAPAPRSPVGGGRGRLAILGRGMQKPRAWIAILALLRPAKEVRLLSVTPKDPPLSPAPRGAFSLLIAPGHTVPVMSRWLGIFALAFLLPPAPANAIQGKPQVIDGDTIVIAGEPASICSASMHPNAARPAGSGKGSGDAARTRPWLSPASSARTGCYAGNAAATGMVAMLGVCHIAGFRGPDINAHLAAEGWAPADRRRSQGLCG